MKIYDISMKIAADMSVYKDRDEKRPVIIPVKRTPEDEINETAIKMDLHTGTHIDGERHMVHMGMTTDQQENLEKLIRNCTVLDFTGVKECITKKDLEKKGINQNDAVLLKTSNSMEDKVPVDFIYLEKTGAEYLAGKNTQVVGIDSLGIERDQKGHPTHKTLMKAGCIIIEGICLKNIPEGKYMMIALPLKIEGADGAPARVVLLENENNKSEGYL